MSWSEQHLCFIHESWKPTCITHMVIIFYWTGENPHKKCMQLISKEPSIENSYAVSKKTFFFYFSYIILYITMYSNDFYLRFLISKRNPNCEKDHAMITRVHAQIMFHQLVIIWEEGFLTIFKLESFVDQWPVIEAKST